MIAGDPDRVVVLHPARPLVLDAAVPVGNGSDVPEWDELLAPVDALAPDGAWPLGLGRSTSAGRVHPAVARTDRTAGGAAWVDRPPSGWPEPVRAAVADVLDEDAGRAPVDARRVPWMRRGWWDETTAWVDGVLAVQGEERSGPLRPVTLWSISAVGEVRTTAGSLWVKALPPYFAREARVVDALGDLVDRGRSDGIPLPGVPRVVARRDDVGGGVLMVTTDVGPVPDDVLPGERERIAAGLARLTAASASDVPRLVRDARLDDRTPWALAAGLARLAEDGVELGLLDADERTALRAAVPRWTDRLLELASSGLPAVLTHGDYHPWNVARHPGWAAGEETAIDWTDAAVGVVGTDLQPVLGRTPDAVSRNGVVGAACTAWATGLGADLTVVRRAVEAALPAAAVVQALAYETIQRASEPALRWDAAGAQAANLRLLLAG